jgi:hypothetical protein
MYKLPKHKNKIVRTRHYRGFVIDILDTAHFGRFRYEYRITSTKRGCFIWITQNVYRHLQVGDQFYDVTSMLNVKDSMRYAKYHVDCVNRPVFMSVMRAK